jgi:uncharacterized protein (UPF0333 family)
VLSYGLGVVGATGATTYFYNTAYTRDVPLAPAQTIISSNANKILLLDSKTPNSNGNVKKGEGPGSEVEAKLQYAIEKAREKCLRVKEVQGLPGLSVAVSVNGQVVWKEGTVL